MSSDLIQGALGGDEDAFRRLVDPYRRELQVHCYRIQTPVGVKTGRSLTLEAAHARIERLAEGVAEQVQS